MKLPNFNSLIQLKNKIISFIVSHRILILASTIVSFSLVALVVLAIKVRSNLLSSMKSAKKDTSNGVYYSATPDWTISNLDNLPSLDNNVLGASDAANSNNVGYDNTFPTPTSYPIITEAPMPTFTSGSTSGTTSTPSCAGTPTAYNSEAIVSLSSTAVNNAVTITVELLDCNNNYATVNDNLTVSLQNSDSSARINGSTSPVNIQAQNGKATFSVNSQNATTDTFVISDTTYSYTVTDPHNHNPSVTFTNNSSGNSNCTTGAGVPNSWFSDVYPASPVSADTGSTVTFTVDIRDCDKNEASVSDTLSISLSSGDSSTKVNGNSLPSSIIAQNGQASFTVTSQNAGTDTFVIQDTSSSFTVTDTNNNNPSVIFKSSSTPTSTPASISLILSCNAIPSSLPADGKSTSHIVLQLKDSNGSTINNQSSVTISSSDSSNSISGNPFTTDGNGNVLFSITSTNQGQPTFTVSENGNSATTSCVIFTQVSTPTQVTNPTPSSIPISSPTPTAPISSSITPSPTPTPIH